MFEQLLSLKKPAPYEPGEPMFWTDPHISGQMLAAHLDPGTDAASYKPERIDASCEFLRRRLPLRPGDCAVDLGCGPGLYCARLARLGCRVTGIDFSRRSVEYARKQAERMENPPEYRVENYLEWSETGRYRAALMVSEDYGVLPPADRQRLLANVRRALQPGGFFVLDVAGVPALDALKERPPKSWSVCGAGFWRPHPHLVLEERFLYPEIPASCHQVAVYDGAWKVYRIHLTYYTPESIARELEQAGFAVEDVLSDLAGKPWSRESLQVGVVCRVK